MATKLTELVMRLFARFQDQRGQALTEYGLILALISVVVISALTLLGGALVDKLGSINGALGASES